MLRPSLCTYNNIDCISARPRMCHNIGCASAIESNAESRMFALSEDEI